MGEIAQKGKKQQPKNQKGVTYFCVFFFFLNTVHITLQSCY